MIDWAATSLSDINVFASLISAFSSDGWIERTIPCEYCLILVNWNIFCMKNDCQQISSVKPGALEQQVAMGLMGNHGIKIQKQQQ